MLRAFLLSLAVTANAVAVPLIVAHHGRLLDSHDTPLSGNLPITVRFYAPEVQGVDQTPLWQETYTAVVVDGFYTLGIGDTTGGKRPLDGTIFETDEDRYLAVKVSDTDELTPRMRIGSSIFALRARTASAADNAAHATAATRAETAGRADTAAVADLATEATHANSANAATLATSAESATHATSATVADAAKALSSDCALKTR